MTRVKICGLKEKSHALAAAEAGADFVGLVFAPSQRQVTPAQAEKIAAAIKQSGCATEVVGVFVNMFAPAVNETAASCGLDWVQLSGNESWEYCRNITKPVIKVIRVSRRQSPREICTPLQEGAKILARRKHVYLLDPKVRGKYGGTGVTFNWKLAQPAAERFPVMVAGGLTPENVAQVIRMVAPWGVDVSSGVEVDEVKHNARIRAFIAAARRTDAEQG